MSSSNTTPEQVKEVQDLIHKVVDVLLCQEGELKKNSGYGKDGKLDWFRILHRAEYQIEWWAERLQVHDAASISVFRTLGPWPMLDVHRLIAGLRNLRAKMETEKCPSALRGEATIRTPKRKKAGRKTEFDPQKDEKLHRDFLAGGMRNIKDFARERGLSFTETDAAFKRVRARRSRDKLS